MKVVVNDTLVLGPPVAVIKYGMSEKDFFELSDEDSNFELFDGELIMRSPASRWHESCFRFLLFLIGGYVDRRGLGVVCGSRFPIRLAPGRLVEPDVLFVARSNLGRVTEQQVEGCADFVVEILSETTRRFDLTTKRAAYHEARTPELWIIDGDNRGVLVDRLTQAGTYQEERLQEGVLRSQAVAGFWIDVGWLWQKPFPDPLDCLLRILG